MYCSVRSTIYTVYFYLLFFNKPPWCAFATMKAIGSQIATMKAIGSRKVGSNSPHLCPWLGKLYPECSFGYKPGKDHHPNFKGSSA